MASGPAPLAAAAPLGPGAPGTPDAHVPAALAPASFSAGASSGGVLGHGASLSGLTSLVVPLCCLVEPNPN